MNNYQLIPKIIHYCWLSNDEVPESLQRYMGTWKTLLPDYEFVHWNFERFDKDSSVWVKEAFDAKKYAFAADLIRCYALYNYGGIYLDMDVEVIKSFDDLLHLPYFICKEKNAPIEAAVIAAEKHHPLFEKMMNYYHDRHFILADGSYDTRTLPRIMDETINKYFTEKHITNLEEFDYNPNVISIFSSDWFSPKSYKDGKICLTDNSYTIHHFASSWHGSKEKLYNLTRKIVGEKIAHNISLSYKSIRRILKCK